MRRTEKFIQKRRFLMVLPLLVIPFITMLFWALGGGRSSYARAQATPDRGLNTNLPNPKIEDGKKAWDKLALYEKAKQDSQKLNEAKKNDPYFKLESLTPHDDSVSKINYSLGTKDLDSAEAKVHRKIGQIYSALDDRSNRNNPEVKTRTHRPRYEPAYVDSSFTSDIDRLEQMMVLMGSDSAADPEMKQIENVLDRIIDVQHPERLQEKIKKESEKNAGRVYQVSTDPDDNISLIKNSNSGADTVRTEGDASFFNGFFGLDYDADTDHGNTIEAVVHDEQTIIVGGSDKIKGSTIKLRLLNDIYINGILIPKDQFIYGEYTISGGRLNVKVNSIRFKNTLFPVSLMVYDLDGVEGLRVPGVVMQEVGKQSAGQAMQDLQLYNLDPSVGAQAATAGVQAATNLMSRKTKMVKVTIKAGYNVFLKDTNLKK